MPAGLSIASAAAPVVGGLLGGNKAAKGSKAAAAAQMNMYNQTRSDLAPYMSTGTSALQQLASLWGLNGANGGVPDTGALTSSLENFPGFQFGMHEGTRALENSGAARGMQLSGQQLRGLNQFGYDYGMQQGWQPYVSMLSSLSSQGAQTGLQLGGLGKDAASASGNFTVGAANQSGSTLAQLGNQGGDLFGGLANGAFGSFGKGAGSGVNVGGMASVSDLQNFAGLF